MAEANYYVSVAKLKERLNLHFPVSITLPDPITGEDWVIQRDDIYNLLLSDPSQLMLEGQTVASLFLEAARMQRACARAGETAAVSYRRWRSQISNQFVASHDKKPPDKMIESYYRAHEHYEHYSSQPDFWKNLANLFGDLKEAFQIKSRMLGSHERQMSGYEGTRKVEALGDDNEMERLNEMAAASIAESRASTKAPADPAAPPEEESEPEEPEAEGEEEEEGGYECPNCAADIADEDTVCANCGTEFEAEEESDEVPPPPEEESEEEDEGEGEGEEEEEEPPPPPPSTSKKTSKRNPGKPGARDGKGKKSTSKNKRSRK